MATITITIPTAVTNRVIEGFCKRYGYSDFLDEKKSIPNPETKPQFVKRRVIEFIKRAVRDSEIETASKAAGDAAGNSADNEIVLT